MISIIIPVYNAENYLSQCLNSIMVQTYVDYEVLLVDDGSTDHSGEICDGYSQKDNRFKYEHIENHGAAYARNVALNKAKGEYFTFVDSDDYIEPEYLERLLSAITEYKADVSQCFWKRPDTVYKELQKKPLLPDARTFNRHEAFMDFVTDNFLCSSVWGKLYKKELFKDIRFPNMRTGEDSSVILKIYERAHRMVSISYIGYVYTLNPGGLDSTRINDLNSVFVGKQVVDYAKENDQELLPYAMTKYALLFLDAYCESIYTHNNQVTDRLKIDLRDIDMSFAKIDYKTRMLLYLIRFSPTYLSYYIMNRQRKNHFKRSNIQMR